MNEMSEPRLDGRVTPRIGVTVAAVAAAGYDAVRSLAVRAADAGFDAVWVPQLPGCVDALTVIAGLAPTLGSRIELASGVVGVQTRHAIVLAAQVRTAQGAGALRLTLGLGVSHRPTVESVYGVPFERPLTHLGEYLTVVQGLLDGQLVEHAGAFVSTVGRLALPDHGPVSTVVAALGPRMLELAGARSDGTITWMVGERTLRDYVVPTITAAAEAAGRAVPPRIVATIPVCVTDEPESARAEATALFGHSSNLPSYRSVMEREGVADPVDLAEIGPPSQVRSAIDRYVAAGATEIAITPFGCERDRQRTLDVIAEHRSDLAGVM